MARVLKTFRDSPYPCPYLPGEVASLEHMVITSISAGENETLLARGFRRFGPDYFRPSCEECHACVPTRIPVAEFCRSTSQARVWRKLTKRYTWNVFSQARVDEERLGLFRTWHAWRESERGWNPSDLREEGYAFQFAFEHPCSRELLFRDSEGKLVGVSLFDETPNALSAAYFFFDPACAQDSLGTANVLALVEFARQSGKEHVYLGFHVKECASLRYKGNFNPREVLENIPDDRMPSVWHRAR